MVSNSSACFLSYRSPELQTGAPHKVLNKISHKASILFRGCLFKKKKKGQEWIFKVKFSIVGVSKSQDISVNVFSLKPERILLKKTNISVWEYGFSFLKMHRRGQKKLSAVSQKK